MKLTHPRAAYVPMFLWGMAAGTMAVVLLYGGVATVLAGNWEYTLVQAVCAITVVVASLRVGRQFTAAARSDAAAAAAAAAADKKEKEGEGGAGAPPG